jgi:hypothetical protein
MPTRSLSFDMTKVEQLERDLQQLTPEERAQFRAWYEAWDAAEWDRQVEADIAAGKLDRVAESAIADYRAGRSRPL